MRFGVLGPLAVWTSDGHPVRVPETKVRALLADLLAHDGEPVSNGQLLEDVWGARQPGDPLNTLQTKMSQLRKALEGGEPGGRELVAYHAASYRLRTSPDAVDASRFRALVARARRSGDACARASLLSEALALWRGPAFAEFVGEPFARFAIQRLDEERLVAVEEHAEARLELGEHRQVAAALGHLVAQNPHRERLRAIQLRALYRSGRQAEALVSFAELREHLNRELGVDPSPELVALHQAILRQEAVLGPAAPRTHSRANLPAAVTNLVGRESQLRQVGSLLERARLVTLTGPGGVGKTALALEAARQLADGYPDGAWVVELAGLGRSAEADMGCALEHSVMAALGIREAVSAGQAHRERDGVLVGALRAKQILLVLDNCEQLIAAVAELAQRLLRAVSGLRILATSQDVLGIAGEVLLPVPPLDVPQLPQSDLAVVRASSAVRLFEERAAAATPGFAIHAGNAHAVATICRRLDGIPLALELAATRLRALGVHELESRLDDRFGLLTNGLRGAPARQQTLRAMIDWSWELLSAAERIVLRRLAIHVEGCTLEAAESVCSGDGVEPTDVLDMLARLVDRSLVVVTEDPRTGERRYRLLESVAAYGLMQAREVGELDRLRQCHSDYYLALAHRARPQLHGHEQRRWLGRLDAEAANLRGVLDGAAQRSDADLALDLVNALVWYWFLRGRLSEARRSMALALSLSGEASHAARAQAVAWQAGINLLGSDNVHQEGLDRWRDIDDRGERTRARWFLGYARTSIADLSGVEGTAEETLTEFRALGDRWGVAAVLSDRAYQAMSRDDLAAAERDARRSEELFTSLGDRWGRVQASAVLGALAEIAGDYEQATRQHREGLWMAEELGLWAEVSYQLSWLGRIALLTRDYQGARELHERAMRLAEEQGFTPGQMYAATGLALGARREGRFDIAEVHLRRVFEWHRQVEFELGNALTLAELGFLAEQRGDAEAARMLHLDGFAIARRFGAPRMIALATEGLAGAEALAGRHQHSARLLGAAAQARHSVGAPLPEAERGDVDRVAAAARRVLGDAAFMTEYERGASLTPEECHALVTGGRHHVEVRH